MSSAENARRVWSTSSTPKFAKLMEYLPDRDRLLLRAGVGWKEGYVGQYEAPPNLDTPIGHAFTLSEPVAIGDYGPLGGVLLLAKRNRPVRIVKAADGTGPMDTGLP